MPLIFFIDKLVHNVIQWFLQELSDYINHFAPCRKMLNSGSSFSYPRINSRWTPSHLFTPLPHLPKFNTLNYLNRIHETLKTSWRSPPNLSWVQRKGLAQFQFLNSQKPPRNCYIYCAKFSIRISKLVCSVPAHLKEEGWFFLFLIEVIIIK